MSYIPPDSHNVILNFKDAIGTPDSHNVILNFGADSVVNYARIKLKTGFKFSATGTNEAPVDNRGTANFKLKTSFKINAQGQNLIDRTPSISINCTSRYQLAKATAHMLLNAWNKPIIRAYSEAFIFEQAQNFANGFEISFDETIGIGSSTSIGFQKTKITSIAKLVSWERADPRRHARTIIYQQALQLREALNVAWEEAIRKRKQIKFSHEVAEIISKRFSFKYDRGLEIHTNTAIPWDVASPVYYRKSKIDLKPIEKPKYQGTGDLNFICLREPDSHNVILNFGAEDCIPAYKNQKWWYIVNTIQVTRLDNNEVILVESGNYSCDRNSWCWSYNLTVPKSEIEKLEPVSGQPVILKILVNGFEHLMLLEKRTRSRQFAKDVYRLTGRSPTALLDSPYSAIRSFLQENERTSVQLVQAEIERSSVPDTVLNWQLIDDLGWIVQSESLSYVNQAPIAVIKNIAESAGGMVYTEPNTGELTLKPLYKKTYWDSLLTEEYDRLIPESFVTDISTDYTKYPNYNGIYLTNDKTGDTGRVVRSGTAGDVLCEAVNNSLFTQSSVMHAFARSKLAKAGMIEEHSLQMPINSKIGECRPGEVVAYNAEWWGIIDSVSVSFTHKIVTQTVGIERVNQDE